MAIYTFFMLFVILISPAFSQNLTSAYNSTRVCDGFHKRNCQNGVCQSKICVCNSGWTGKYCQLPKFNKSSTLILDVAITMGFLFTILVGVFIYTNRHHLPCLKSKSKSYSLQENVCEDVIFYSGGSANYEHYQLIEYEENEKYRLKY